MPRKSKAKAQPRQKATKENGKITRSGLSRPYSCSQCDKSYQTKTILRTHHNTHTDRYQCELCGRKCSSSTSLGIHKRIHTGEKPYACSTCVYRASDKSGLRQHVETCKGMNNKIRRTFAPTVPRHETKQEDLMREYLPMSRIKHEEGVDAIWQFNSLHVEDDVSLQLGTSPSPKMPATGRLLAPDEVFQPVWAPEQPERLEGYDPYQLDEPGHFEAETFDFPCPVGKKDKPETDLHARLDQIACLLGGLQQENERMNHKFNQVLNLLRKQQNIPRAPRPLPIESYSSDDESDDKSPEQARPHIRKTRRQRKKHVSKPKNSKKKPAEVKEREFITPLLFNLTSKCAFCWLPDHTSDDCSNYKKLEWRLGFRDLRNLCNLCLCFHPSRICFMAHCPYCSEQNQHHPALCPSEKHLQFLELLEY